MTDTTEEFLAHYGVKGMRWGVVREESTSSAGGSRSLIRSAKTAASVGTANVSTSAAKARAIGAKRELAAKKFDLKVKDLDKEISQLKNNPGKDRYAQIRNKDKIDTLTRDRDQAKLDAQFKREGKLSSTQKKLLIGGAIVGGVLVAGTAYSLIQSGQGRQLMEKGKALVTGKPFEFKKKANLAEKMSAEDAFQKVVKAINPDYPGPGNVVNCRRCTFAYEMRRRGFDVMATETNTGSGQTALGLYNAISGDNGKTYNLPTGVARFIFDTAVYDQQQGQAPKTALQELFDSKVPGKSEIKDAGVKSILEALSGQPEGSRGELGVEWTAGGGHSMAYEIFKGKAVVFDTQTGQKLDTPELLTSHGLDKLKAAAFTRLDNIDLNDDFLMRWVKNADEMTDSQLSQRRLKAMLKG